MGLFESPPALCGHRGSGRGVVGGFAENTLASCRAAVEWGMRWLEIDCRLNAEGVLVARHDPRVEDGRFVADLSSAETDALGLMRLEDMFEALPLDVGIDLEVKTALEDALRPRDETTAAAAADLAARASAAGRPVLLTSFDASVLPIAAERHPALPTGLLTWTRFPLRKAIPAAVHLGARVVAPQFASFPLPGTPAEKMERELADAIDVAHRAGLEVVAWCPKPPEEKLLAAAGVDCIIVDDVLGRA
ncbi:MAG: putative glycerophosphoryl diester phosphodiesterase [Solirubrobacterales bacterium]|nr:putative glycerophosphoryl diester phosphodiesterase [Solirubrobacterales bacterium]